MKRLSTVLLAILMTASLFFWAVLPAVAQEKVQQEEKSADESSFTLEEIIVTAEKSEENLQKISRSMAVLSSEELRKNSNGNFMEALGNVGGVNFMGNWNHIYIRGVGHTTAEEGSEPGVQFNVDGAPALLIEGSTTSPMFQASNDVERVEVIRGPSGSVNGRSAAAGTVNVISKSPDFEQVDGDVGITIGNYDTIRLNAALNLPMKLTGLDLPSYLENLSFRVAAAENKHEAFIDNADGEPVKGVQNYYTVRTKMKWQPIEPLTFDVTFNYTRDASDMNMTVPAIGGAPGVMIEGGPPFPLFSQDAHEDDPWSDPNASKMGEPTVNRQYNTNYEATYETGIGTITGRYSYSWVPVTCAEDDDDCYEGNRYQKDYELRLNSPEDSRIKWMVGGYYFNKKTYTGPDETLGEVNPDENVDFYDFYGNENLFDDDTIFDPSSPNPGMDVNDTSAPWRDYFTAHLDPLVPYESAVFVSTNATRPIDSYSVFANATVPMFEDKHRLVIGLRQNYERKKRAVSIGVFAPDDSYGGYPHFTFEDENNDGEGTWVCDNCELVATEGPGNLETDDNPLTYTLGWEYDWRPEVMVYAQVSNGYKPGGISPNSVPNVFYEPEYLTNYAVGTKSRWYDNRLQLNGEIFLMDYENYQTNLAADNASITYEIDGETYVQTYGFQSRTVNFPRTYIYGADLDFDLLISPVDRFNGTMEFKHAEYGDLKYHLGIGGLPGTPEYTDFDGRPMPYAPKFTFTGNYSHIFNYGNFQVTPRVSAKYSTKYFLYTEYWFEYIQPEMWQPAYWKFDAYVNIGPQDGTWNLNLYCKNATEEVIRNMAMFNGVNLDEPRTYGATFQVRF